MSRVGLHQTIRDAASLKARADSVPGHAASVECDGISVLQCTYAKPAGVMENVEVKPAIQNVAGIDPAPITDKKGLAKRWLFSVRQIDNFLAAGMPHMAIGKRRVRIVIAEADAWLRERYGTRRKRVGQW